jgi:Tetracyclin repressor-like, C-terminal domain
LRRALPDGKEADLYWGLHFALAMAHQTIRDSERLSKLSEGSCDLDDVQGIIERIVAVSAQALTEAAAGKRAIESKAPKAIVAQPAR